MLEHYTWSFGKDEELVLKEYWREGLKVKEPKKTQSLSQIRAKSGRKG